MSIVKKRLGSVAVDSGRLFFSIIHLAGYYEDEDMFVQSNPIQMRDHLFANQKQVHGSDDSRAIRTLQR